MFFPGLQKALSVLIRHKQFLHRPFPIVLDAYSFMHEFSIALKCPKVP